MHKTSENERRDGKESRNQPAGYRWSRGEASSPVNSILRTGSRRTNWTVARLSEKRDRHAQEGL